MGLGACCYTNPANLTAGAIQVYFAPIVSSPLRKAQFHSYIVALAKNPLLVIEPALRQSQVPVRIVWGMGDTIFDSSSAEWLSHAFPQSRGVRKLPEARLFFPEELPDVIGDEARKLWLGK